ncbi:MAG: phosphoribosylformylglycinamidine synthase [Planctomycetaceae bacterium]|nr:phosphoribosylformylglycinamidine synthase [Planctomycetaceae bacterium]
MSPKACILRAPGTNCDEETAFAFEMCGANATRVHLFELLKKPELLTDYQILCIPGGFSYGDDIGAGVIFSNQLRNHLAETIGDFLQSDKLVLGICNGFQVLLKSGILPGGADGWKDQTDRPVTLTWNDNGRYTARWVKLKSMSPRNVFLRGIEDIELPIAHAEGRLVARDSTLIDDWRESGQIAVCYQNGESNGNWREPLPFPENPNGSDANIAGLGDPSGRVLGLMPHPERFIHATQHPQWTRLRLKGDGAGKALFQNAVDYFSAN